MNELRNDFMGSQEPELSLQDIGDIMLESFSGERRELYLLLWTQVKNIDVTEKQVKLKKVISECEESSYLEGLDTDIETSKNMLAYYIRSEGQDSEVPSQDCAKEAIKYMDITIAYTRHADDIIKNNPRCIEALDELKAAFNASNSNQQIFGLLDAPDSMGELT